LHRIAERNNQTLCLEITDDSGRPILRTKVDAARPSIELDAGLEAGHAYQLVVTDGKQDERAVPLGNVELSTDEHGSTRIDIDVLG
jgi:hypothetical protein